MEGSLILFAIDLELSGCRLDKDNIIAIGWSAIQLTNGETISQGVISLQSIPTRPPFEPRCYDEFWSKNLPLLKTLQTLSVPPSLGISRFFETLDELDRKCEVRIISDNPCSDIAWIDMYASMFLDRKPLCYRLNTNQWRPIYDTDSFSRGVAKIPYRDMYTSNSEVMKILKIDPKQIPIATHNPMDDARSIVVLHRLVYLKQFERQEI